MFISMDRVVKFARTLKAKVSGIIFGNKYNTLRKTRNDIQAKVILNKNPSLICK